MDRIRNRPKMPPRIKTAADAIKADSAEIAKMKLSLIHISEPTRPY